MPPSIPPAASRNVASAKRRPAPAAALAAQPLAPPEPRQPALSSRYRGALDSHDWSGVVLSFARGDDVFTVLGMTYADSDLIQIQENVIAKTIASLQFTAQ